jgi:phage major head subunit gpT-like protein
MSTELLSQREVVGMFYAAIAQWAHPWADRLSWRNGQADRLPGENETYAWLGQSPTPREFVGGRQPQQLATNAYEITNKRWESSIEVPKLHWIKDKTGQIQIRVQELARRYGVHKARLISTLKIGGGAALCYDGQYFYDTDHAEGASGTQSNLISANISDYPCTQHGIVTAPSPCEMAHSIMAAIAAMLSFKDNQGEPMQEEASEFLVMVPTTLWLAAILAVGAKVLDGGDDNVVAIGKMNGLSISVAMNARLNAWTDSFTVDRLDGQVKPFIYQEDGGDTGINMKILGPDSEYACVNDRCLVTTDTINNAGYGYWQQSVKVTMI